eukprot:TRINITY_DN56050_c0_g1_i1.p1 TRINITY_DN56050_c0_g1~~TRINITY_DN56050_c0_g1_i1.p1  ORF type:complete len:379 (+),score=107.17 TRINITY_DN56050_c0_g1_i1:157-1293(+)
MAADAAKRRSDANFNRMFKDEFLVVRKDVLPSMLAAARGDYDDLVKCLENKEYEVHVKNRDGNTLLLLSVANQNLETTQFLLDAKSDILHKNILNMDALDYATMNGLRDPLFKAILAHCDFVVPEILEGQYQTMCSQALAHLRSNGLVPVRTNLAGNTPDFSDVLGKGTEYQRDWLKDLNFMCHKVKKGMLLLNDEIAYLEHDSLLTGCLEVPVKKRYVFHSKDGKCVNFAAALKSIYSHRLELRMVDAAIEGNATCIKALLMANASPVSEDPHGQTLLMRAAHNGCPTSVRCLLRGNAPVATKNKDGFDALMVAATQGNEKAVMLLLKAKADPTLKSFKGYTALDFVRHAGHTKLLRILQAHLHKMHEQQQLKRSSF